LPDGGTADNAVLAVDAVVNDVDVIELGCDKPNCVQYFCKSAKALEYP
jgi:hypothetical protein